MRNVFHTFPRGFALLWVIIAASSSVLLADTSVDYLKEIKPLLTKHCYKCHSSIAMEGDVRLDSHSAIVSGESPIVVAHDPTRSRLLELVRGSEGERMPPTGPGLDVNQIALLERWVSQGAIGPPDGDESRVDHWAFKPPTMPPLAQPQECSSAINLIDAILFAEQDRLGIQRVKEADRNLLLRRLYIDLIGITPSPEEIDAFQNDNRDGAYEAVVDRLLASPMYAQRWARHWMDVWRYSDWDGFGEEIRESQPHIWRWREWIIRSLTEDKPYNQMITEMLAGDEIPNSSDETIAATGFLARQWYKFNRNTWLENTVEHTSKAFMGITMNCAKCHDHMYDPISQKEYYSLRAFFEPLDIRTDRLPNNPDTKLDGLARIFDKQLDSPTFIFHRGNEKTPLIDKPVQPSVPKVFNVQLPEIAPVSLEPAQYYLARRDYVQRQLISAADSQVEKTKADAEKLNSAEQASELERRIANADYKAAIAARASLEARLLADNAKFGSDSKAADASDANYTRLAKLAKTLELQHAIDAQQVVVLRAEHSLAKLIAEETKKADSAESTSEPVVNQAQEPTAIVEQRNKLAALQQTLSELHIGMNTADSNYTSLTEVYPEQSTGRRLALAKWITDRQHPLTARVAVNHVWLRHFGKPLVESTFDFGLNGREPENQDVLDALAVEFMNAGWSFKKLHRMIVTSRIYRQRGSSASLHSHNFAIDPDNKSYWHSPSRRMEAEVIRDTTLSIAGNLDLSGGGPDLDPNTADNSLRRSIYYRCSKEKRPVYLALFDGPSVVECYRRNESIVPHQALALMNSDFNYKHAQDTTRLIRAAISEDVSIADSQSEAFIARAFLTILGRSATAQEIEVCKMFLQEQSRRLNKEASASTIEPAAEVSLVLVLFNHHEFITIP